MSYTGNLPETDHALSILKGLPIEDRLFIIERPHIRSLLNSQINSDLANALPDPMIRKNIKELIRGLQHAT